ncbi:predicted protein [Naegleria gruberi]|uniref:Predicted protein n=1 Tax=Naegleria gruberi TaxID=5762 RepID=D2VIU6_NAEGR|nr:uncharacterized protein NAEGRDRAFT_49899 [Naegleria gruberi]EFC43335.1 predicted protein [Naegleria gruberi]|eukprot:XP_002676079.1 predicted protein [Naegleria gruberi strain NEG-M]
MGNISGSTACDYSNTTDYASPRQRRFTCKSTTLERHYSIASQPPISLPNSYTNVSSLQTNNNTSILSSSPHSPKECQQQSAITQKLMTFLRFNPHYSARTIPEEQELWRTIIAQSGISCILSTPSKMRDFYLSGYDSSFLILKPKIEELEYELRPVLKHFGSFDATNNDVDESRAELWQLIDTPDYDSADVVQMAKLNKNVTGLKLLLLPSYPSIPKNSKVGSIPDKNESLTKTMRYLLSPLAVDLIFDTREEIHFKPVVAIGSLLLEWDSTVGLCIPRHSLQLSKMLIQENCIYSNDKINMEEALNIASELICEWNLRKPAIFSSFAPTKGERPRKQSIGSYYPPEQKIFENRERTVDSSAIHFAYDLLENIIKHCSTNMARNNEEEENEITQLFFPQTETCTSLLIKELLQYSSGNTLKLFDGGDSISLRFPVTEYFRESFDLPVTSPKFIEFNSHKEFDEFVLGLLDKEDDLAKKFPSEYAMLKCIDRCFWVGHLHDDEEYAFAPKRDCPFTDPSNLIGITLTMDR